MICKFCGLNNADDAAFCSRCGSPLKENRKPAPHVPSADPVVDDDKKTMRMGTPPEEPKNGGMITHDCGYPLLPGMTVCPQCHCKVGGGSLGTETQLGDGKKADDNGFSSDKKTERFVGQDQNVSNAKKTERFVGQDQNVSNAKKTERFVGQDQNVSNAKKTERFVAQDQNVSNAKKTERFVSYVDQEGGVNKKTVDIHQLRTPKVKETEPVLPPHCSLKPVAREAEDATKLMKQEFESAEVVLNRQNTDPENFTITSQQQALLVYENGKWFIEDRSAYKSTYVRASRRIELQDGDVVAMGDREFEFSTK
ncbi:MAG: zinc ribbon domain-containing protein [Bacteroidales bacterium]|nr:zinc ribbon domain-containing protein [Bacteroidales bacterium]